MTRILVAYATKMGSTREIAEVIGDVLQKAGHDTTVSEVDGVEGFAGFDAAVVGSAVYMGHWRPEAVELLEQQVKLGVTIPVWLFQSGPFDRDSHTADKDTPKKVHALAAALDTAAPMTFGGRIEPSTAIGFIAKRMAKGPNAGDYRDFDQIRRWARDIAAQLAPATTGAPEH